MNILRLLLASSLLCVALHGADALVYKKVGDHELHLHIEKPTDWKASDKRPTIVFFGDEDKLIPVSVLREFEIGMKKAGVRCEARVYPKAGHGFFNRDPHFTLTLIEADKFLASLGWLKGPPTVSVTTK